MAKTCTIIKDGRADTYGRPLLVGQTYTGPDDEVFSLWQSGFASVAGAPGAFMPATQIQQFVIAVSNIPFVIMPGDGSANGCQFTGTNGAFTLSAAILTGSGAYLAGCYAYFSANFGGSSLPAGWYWTEFSSDTAGIVYAETLNGIPKRQNPKTPITPNLSGWVTATTSEVAVPYNILLPATAMGKNGRLVCSAHIVGSTSSTKTIRMRDVASAAQLFSASTSTTPVTAISTELWCLDSHTAKAYDRTFGAASATFAVAPFSSVDTSVDRTLQISLQQSANTAAPIVTQFSITATYGE